MRGAVTNGTIAAPWIGAPVAAWTRPEIDTAPGGGWSRGCGWSRPCPCESREQSRAKKMVRKSAHSGQRQDRNSSVRRSSSPMTNAVASFAQQIEERFPRVRDRTKSLASHGNRVVAAGRQPAHTELAVLAGVALVRAAATTCATRRGPRRTRKPSHHRAVTCPRRGPHLPALTRAKRSRPEAGRRLRRRKTVGTSVMSCAAQHHGPHRRA